MLLMDVHPATVTLPDGCRHQLARAVLTHRRLRVWIVDGRSSLCVLDTAHDGIRLDTRYPLIGRAVPMDTAAGTVTVTRMAGCGCGSPLKALRPPTDDTVGD